MPLSAALGLAFGKMEPLNLQNEAQRSALEHSKTILG